MNEDLHIEDGSGDKKYFTMVPNIILNHSTAVDQALYLQMKRFAGEGSGGGYCTASLRTLKKKLGVGHPVVKKSLAYLLEHKWIENVGSRKVMTDGGTQEVQIYRVNDIWKLNTDFYQGGAEIDHPVRVVTKRAQGGNENAQGGNENAQGGAKQQPTKNYIKHIELSAAEPRELVSDEDTGKSYRFPPAKYPHALEVFTLWGKKYPRQWASLKDSREREAAENLYLDWGIDAIKKMLEYWNEYRAERYCPSAVSPLKLSQNWGDLILDKQKRGL